MVAVGWAAKRPRVLGSESSERWRRRTRVVEWDGNRVAWLPRLFLHVCLHFSLDYMFFLMIECFVAGKNSFRFLLVVAIHTWRSTCRRSHHPLQWGLHDPQMSMWGVQQRSHAGYWQQQDMCPKLVIHSRHSTVSDKKKQLCQLNWCQKIMFTNAV